MRIQINPNKKIYSSLLILMLGGCAGTPPTEVIYALENKASANSSIVSVLDKRPSLEKTTRLKDSGASVYLGDNNFKPDRFGVLRDRLVSKFTNINFPVEIEIESFELIVYNPTGRVGMLSATAPAPENVPSLPREIVIALTNPVSDRIVICAIDGKINNVRFRVNEYKTVSPGGIDRGFGAVLEEAVNKIAVTIRSSHSGTKGASMI